MKGKVVVYFKKHGHGFIRSDEVDEDIFFYGANTRYKAVVGDEVEFELLKHENGLRAIKVRSVKNE